MAAGKIFARSTEVPQGKPGQYPEYMLGGQPFSKLQNDTPAWLEKAQMWVADKLLRAGAAAVAPFDTSARVFKEAALERRATPFTQKDFTPAQLATLAQAVKNAQKAGRTALNYEDYRAGAKSGFDANPWPTVIGRAQITPNPQGGVDIVDTYDFNNYEGSNIEARDFGPAWYGRRALPSGIRGVPVRIALPSSGMAKAKK